MGWASAASMQTSSQDIWFCVQIELKHNATSVCSECEGADITYVFSFVRIYRHNESKHPFVLGGCIIYIYMREVQSKSNTVSIIQDVVVPPWVRKIPPKLGTNTASHSVIFYCEMYSDYATCPATFEARTLWNQAAQHVCQCLASACRFSVPRFVCCGALDQSEKYEAPCCNSYLHMDEISTQLFRGVNR
jgi:hypothetical protein